MGFALLFFLFYYSAAYAEERVVQYDMTFVTTNPDILGKLYSAFLSQNRNMVYYVWKAYEGKIFVLTKGDPVDWIMILPNTDYVMLRVKIDGKKIICYGFSDAFVPKR